MTTPVLSQEDRDRLHFEALWEHHEEDMSWEDREEDEDADS